MAFFDPKPSIAAASVAVLDKPRLETAPRKIKPRVDTNTMHETAIADYRATAEAIGLPAQDILVEEFRLFLAKHDLPIFNHQEVVSYMDDIAAKDNPTGLGWHWCPVRPKDAEAVMTFGRPSVDNRNRGNGQSGITPASDFYESHAFQSWYNQSQERWGGGQFVSHSNGTSVHVESNVRLMQAAHDEPFLIPPRPHDWRSASSPAYTRTLPLHALKKIALVEKNFTAGRVMFLVTDYTIAPHVVINPDPFLMAVIPNSAVAHGKGRFIIDVWDEPGFGIDRMVK